MSRSIHIHEVSCNREIKEVYRFRYKVYVEEMARDNPYICHVEKHISSPMDTTGHVYGAFRKDGKVVGTGRINYCRDGNVSFYPELMEMDLVGAMHPGHTSIGSKFMVHSRFRKTRLSLDLMQALVRRAIADNMLYIFIDSNAHLIPMYKKLGFREYRGNISHPYYGETTPMVLYLGDLAYFRQIGSLFLEVCEEGMVNNRHFASLTRAFGNVFV